MVEEIKMESPKRKTDRKVHVVYIALFKSEEKRFPEVIGVFVDPAEAAKTAATFMDFSRVWNDEYHDRPVTKERVEGWEPAPGDDAEWEFSSDGEVVMLQMHEVTR